MKPNHFSSSRALGATALLATLTLAGCGGGGSDGTGATAAASAGATASVGGSPAVATAAPATTPASAPAPSGTASAAVGSTCNIADFTATALLRINALRAAGADCRTGGRFAAAAPLTSSTLLTQSAEAHSQDMAAANFFAHTGSSGSTPVTRVDATGYAWSALGENIAAGYVGLDAVIAGWMASDGHCANVMNPNFNQIGLVCVPGTATSGYGTYWTMDLARSR